MMRVYLVASKASTTRPAFARLALTVLKALGGMAR